MEEMYWKQFLETGKVEDYLTYKGMEICRQVMKKHEGEPSDEPDNSDWLCRPWGNMTDGWCF